MGLVDAWGGNAFGWFFANMIEAYYNFGYALTHPALWLDWSNKESIMRFIYYGASVELFFVIVNIVLIVTVIGLVRNSFMWGCVRGAGGHRQHRRPLRRLGGPADGAATDRHRLHAAGLRASPN